MWVPVPIKRVKPPSKADDYTLNSIIERESYTEGGAVIAPSSPSD